MRHDDLPLTIPALLERAASMYPAARAYVEGSAASHHAISWAELLRESRELAAGLIAAGLIRGDRVAICAENSIDWIKALHAVSLAGGIAVLVYYELREAELRHQIGHPGSRFLIAGAEQIVRAGDIDCVEQVVCLGGAGDYLTLERTALLATETSRQALAHRRPAPDDLAAIIYTSGTTGGAKGVMLSHRNFLSNGASTHAAIDFGPSDSVMLVLPLHHAMPFIATVVLACIVGATVFIENDLRRIRDRLGEYKPTIFFGVPALYEIVYRNILARAETEGRLKMLQRALSLSKSVKAKTGINLGPLLFRTVHQALGGRLRFMVCGGAALDSSIAREYMALGLPLLQGWGMSEASPVVAVQPFSSWRFRFTNHYERLVGSVGPAVPGVQVRLIDVPEKDIRVAVSGEGEVIVQGANVFRGYWNAPEATDAAMLNGWLRTGDLARIDKHGNIFLTGRSKYIIVLNSGEKVHPDELEAVYARSDLIEDIAIIERRGPHRVIVAAIIYPSVEATRARLAAENKESTAGVVRTLIGAEIERLGRELAAFKRVSDIELSDAPLPKTPLRKVARGQLQEGYEFAIERWLASAEAG